MNLLSVKGLAKVYPNFVLQEITFSLAQGRIMGLIGKNGAGKSTTLKGMLHLVCPSGGNVEMMGRDFVGNEEYCKQNIGVVFGEIDFYKEKKLADITAVTKRFYKNWDEQAYKHYMQIFELDSQKKVRELSSGMRVKYMIAMALSHGAKLLILDEPTSGLDPVSREDLLELFRTLVKDGSRSILFSTHITSDLEKCADDITYIKDGKLLATEEKETFIQMFSYLKKPEEKENLSLEEIMIRSERRVYNV